MALDPVIDEVQTEAKQPIDQDLMDSIRENLERIDGLANKALDSSGGNVVFKVNGRMGRLTLPADGDKIDGGFLTSQQKVTTAKAYIKEFGGVNSTVSFDITRRKVLNFGIDRIENLFTSSIQQIARASSPLLTQSIERATPSKFTQAVGFLLGSITVNSIVNTTGTQFRINLAGTGLLDTSLYQIGDYVELDGTDGQTNDGIFEILEVNRDNSYNLILNIPAGADQLFEAGNLTLNISVYSLPSTAEAEAFEIGETVTMLGHGDVSNDGDFIIFKTNYGGNNIVIKRTTEIIVQGGVGGEVKTNRYKYNYIGAVDTDAFGVGEDVTMAAHTDPPNNGTFVIKALNFAGENIIVYNPLATLQATDGGTALTYRFIYLLNVDPSGVIEVGDSINVAGAVAGANNGTFTIVGLAFNATDSFVIYNTSGVDQPLPSGTANKTEMAVVMYEDPSPFFLEDQSNVELLATQGGLNDGIFAVKGVNRQGVSVYNLIVEIGGGTVQPFPSGQVVTEISSIFTSVPSFTITQDLFTIDLDDLLADYTYEEGTILTMDLLQAPTNAVDLSVNIK